MKAFSSCLHNFLLLQCMVSLNAFNVYAQSFDEALRALGLTAFADFIRDNPSDLLSHKDIAVYVPTNEAVAAWLLATSGDQRDGIKFRRADDGFGNAAANNQVAQNSGPTQNWEEMKREGEVQTTGRNQTSPSGAKVREPNTSKSAVERPINEPPPPPQWVGKMYSGSGQVSYVLEQGHRFDNGIFHITDSFFKLAGNLSGAISDAGLTYLDPLLSRLPGTLHTLEGSNRITFLAPSQGAFAAAGIDPETLSTEELQAIFDYHTIISGFIGYTPTFQDGRSYKTKSGTSFVVTRKGMDTYINNAKIIGKNSIIQNGVIQIIDKVLIPPKPGATTVPGPDGPVQIVADTAEDDDPMNPNPHLTPNQTTPTRTNPPVQHTGAATARKIVGTSYFGAVALLAWYHGFL
ncbi:FAS1 domain-containing protein [Kalaharituber pfeilii]|nr:FAS1 domain-containing protein [Kalaharituber pfeilii]